MNAHNFRWIDVAIELGVMPEVITEETIDQNGEVSIIRKMPHMKTEAARDKWERKKNKASDWAYLVLRALQDGMTFEQGMFVAKQCIEAGRTPKQAQTIYKNAVTQAVKAVKKKKAEDAIPRPEAFGEWS